MNRSIKCGLLTCVLNTGLQLYYRSLYIAGLGSGYSGCVFPLPSVFICDPPQDFNAKGESTRTTRFHFKTKEFILTRFSTLAILPH